MMSNKIISLSVPNDVSGFFKGKHFEWNNIPDFVVITGINGSGKTQLFNFIDSVINQNKSSNYIVYSQKNTVLLSHEKHYQKVYIAPSVDSNIIQNGQIETLKVNRKQEIQSLLRQFANTLKVFHTVRDDNNGNIYINSSDTPNVTVYNAQQYIKIREFVEYILQDKASNDQVNNDISTILSDKGAVFKEFFSTNDTDINGYINSYIVDENTIASIKISELFLQYRSKINDLQAKAYREKKNEDFISSVLKEIFNTDEAPWRIINKTLEQYGFQHRVVEPNDSIYELSFNDGIKYGSLSTGEQIIFHLICSAYSGNGGIQGKTKLLLLDEFDAHLNPTMSKMFIEIVQNILVKQFDIQVIMTTHSPSTVAYVSEESLFWMEKGKILEGQDKKEKMWIIHKLATGFVSEDSSCPFMSYLVDPTKPYYILVEGYTDILHIKSACKKLGGDYEKHILNKCNFINLGGTKEVYAKSFISNFAHGKKVITILDHDKSGVDLHKDVFNNGYEKNKTISDIKQHKKDIIGILLTSKNTVDYQKQIDFGYIPIELMYPKSIIDDFNTKNPGFLRNVADIKDLEIFYANFGTASSIEGCFVVQKDKLKLEFAKHIQVLDISYFDGFKPTLDLMLTIINNWNDTTPSA